MLIHNYHLPSPSLSLFTSPPGAAWPWRKLLAVCGILGAFVAFAAAGACMAAAVGLADFCMDPPLSAMACFANRSSENAQVVQYYLQCSPPSPPAPAVQDYIDEMRGEVRAGQVAVAALRLQLLRCPAGAASVNAMAGGLGGIWEGLATLEALNACGSYSPALSAIMYRCLCGEAGERRTVFYGTVLDWVAYLVLAVLLPSLFFLLNLILNSI